MGVVNHMFGVASAAAFARCGGSGVATRHLLEAIASGFGGAIDNGQTVHDLMAAANFSQIGFDGSSAYKLTLEDNVLGFGTSYGRVGAAAIIYAYANTPSLEKTRALGYINQYRVAVNSIFSYSFAEYQQTGLDAVMSGFSVNTINAQIASDTGVDAFTGKAVNYNWYDTEPLFVNLALAGQDQLMKDIENQYYYLTGELLYSNLPTGLAPCVEYSNTISTPTGDIVVHGLAFTPCLQADSYVGPVSGVKFFRVFNDGPPSSGKPTPEVLQAYGELDKSMTEFRDWYHNSAVIYANAISDDGLYRWLKSGAQIDVTGPIQTGLELGYGHTNLWDEVCSPESCLVPGSQTWPVNMSMHLGDATPKYYYHSWVAGTYPDTYCACETGIMSDWTGWKLAPLRLGDEWTGYFRSFKTNPNSSASRMAKRALNLDNKLSEEGLPITPYVGVSDTGDGVLTCDGYAGPPQLNGVATLPSLVFVQTFDNTNFSSYASVALRWALSSGGEFVVADRNLFSGSNGSHYGIPTTGSQAIITFNTGIHSSGMATADEVTKKCLTIGDNFGNSVSSVSSQQSNAGFQYTGYVYSQFGQQVSVSDLLAQQASIVGNQFKTINYINGYRSGVHTVSVSPQYGFIITGDTSTGINYTGERIQYDYFSNGQLGAENYEWNDSFAPVPQGVIDNGLLPTYASTRVENYFPRYVSGPYLSYNTKFLYPRASGAATQYSAVNQGFPASVTYQVSIKEETVREIFRESGLTTTRNVYVVRAKNGSPLTLETKMVNPFTPLDSTYSFKYNFLLNKSLYPDEGGFWNDASLTGEFVNADYVPSADFCTQTRVNSVVYQGNNLNFNQGLRYTGQLKDRLIYTGIGRSTTIAVSEPAGGGLYWGFQGRKVSGVMNYISPLFDLGAGAMTYTQGRETAMISYIFNTSPVSTNNGSLVNGSLFGSDGYYNGKDPIYYEYLGGRSGSGAALEGGYHSKGLVGDAWYNVNVERWGESSESCFYDTYQYHDPQGDSYVLLWDASPTGMTLHGRGFSYYPFTGQWRYQPFTTTNSHAGIPVTNSDIGSEYYFDFDMRDYFFPLLSGSGLYSSSGLTVGPFDRDVELCITGNNHLTPSGSLIVDGVETTNPSWNGNGCVDPITKLILNSGIARGVAGRAGQVTTFKLVPSGQTVNLNISGDSGLIGCSGHQYVTLRPRTCFGATSFYGATPAAISGDIGYMDNLRYINNGSEVKIPFPASSFEGLVGQTFSKTVNGNVEVLFPVPDSGDFDAVVRPSFDALGNKVYPSRPTEKYWRQKIQSNQAPNMWFPVTRESTRIYVKIDEISVNRGDIPYQSFMTLIPSGQCTVSGRFGYTGQAESAIVSDGMVITGLSGARSLSGIWEPVYVSDVLQRLPTGIYVLPSGSGIRPVLAAPSYMKTRTNSWMITGGDAMSPLEPSVNSHYNRFKWPAWSDLGLLNPEVVYEEMPPDDGSVFLDSYPVFTASQGQDVGTGKNLVENVIYGAVAHYTFYDSLSTNALYNTGKCIVSGVGSKNTLTSGDLSGVLTTEGNPLTMAINLGAFSV